MPLEVSSSQALPLYVLPPEMTQAEFHLLSAILGKHLGFRFPDNKQRLVAGRLAGRLRELGLDNYQAYASLLEGPDGEQEMLHTVELITTNETFFFREPVHFDFLRQIVLPPLVRSGKKVRAWSAASSSGQEAYSIAMVLADVLGLEADWKVIGTDVSMRVLKHARRGMYLMDEVRHIAPDALKHYCLRGNDEYEGKMLVSRGLRRHVVFNQANLMSPLAQDLNDFDVVFLRNVLIYFENNRKDDLIERIRSRINQGGYLIVGHTESMSVRVHGFTQIRPSVYLRD